MLAAENLRHGIVQVRMSPDNMTAFILWDAHSDCLHSAERELSQRCAGECFLGIADHSLPQN